MSVAALEQEQQQQEQQKEQRQLEKLKSFANTSITTGNIRIITLPA